MLAWLHGKILFVDLAKDVVREVSLGEDVYKLLLGGRGLASYLVAVNSSAGVDPLSPGNPLVVSPGVLVGSGVPTASKTIFAAKSPLTGFIGRSSVGAWLGVELGRVGYDAVVVTGALEEPGVLVIDCDGVRVEPARELWGLTVSRARTLLAEKYPGYRECVIGPAGERLSRIASIDCNGRQAGRTGIGAVMGSKKLKAIVVKGCRDREPAKPAELRRLAAKYARELLRHPASKTIMEYGTPAMMNYTNKAYGVFPSLNWREATLDWAIDPQKAHEELSSWAPKRRIGRNPCPHCNRVCSQVIKVSYKGENVRVDGPEYETVYSLGACIGIDKLDPIAVLNHIADEYGVDTISLGVTIAWAIEALERGDLSPEDIDGLGPRWGDVDSIIELAKRIAGKIGHAGELLGDGVRVAVEKLKRGQDYAMHVKGLELPAYDARGLKGMALGYAVSSRGGDHLTSGAYAVELPGKLWVYEGVEPRRSQGKGVLVKTMEDVMAVFDVTGICKFSRYMLGPEEQALLVSNTIGYEMDVAEILTIGERVVNIERLFNLREGLRPEKDDTLPPRLYREPIRRGPCKDCIVSGEELREMKREYYAARGWNPQTGIPGVARLRILGIDKIIDLSQFPIDRSL